ncbi:hypothetical protein N7493_005657 [Penicillium malachiteum]|uniref:Uncharacterized protein n=1 Tax=Penicillium malachiteum TaxID=1324776 RepID=A0AAD6HNE4_9EURO|nr:hypothetical protein N7493_005657 [Penicillium malachiteum]
MRRFYYGPKAGLSTDSLSYTQARHCPKNPGPVIISLFSWEAQICPSPPGLHFRMQDIIQDFTCNICNTKSYIEVRVTDSEDSSTMTIVMTRWVNLGRDLTQDDELWSTHLEWTPFPLGQVKVLHDNLYTNPRFYFEGMASKSFKELETRNLSYLKDNEYVKFMSPEHISGIGWPEMWHTVFKEPPESKERPKMKDLKSLSFLLRFLKKARR